MVTKLSTQRAYRPATQRCPPSDAVYCVILSLAVAAVGCVDPRSGAELRVQVDTLPNGIVHVANPDGLGWGNGIAWELREDLRIGAAGDAEAPDRFAYIASLAVDESGNIYILEGFDQEVRVFDSSGAFVRRFGSKGEGPGEFSAASGLHVSPDGNIWVTDSRRRRYSVFSPEGILVDTPIRPLQGFVPGAAQFAPDGRFVDWAIGFPQERPDVVAGARIVYQPVLLSADASQHERLPPLDFEREMVADGSRPLVFFASGLRIHQDRAGAIWFAQTRQYRIWKRTLTGDTTLVASLPAVAAPINEEDREFVRQRMESRPELLSSYLDALPEIKPVIDHLFGDNAGHIFVVPELAGVPAGTAVDVFTDEGIYKGRMALPTRPARNAPPPIATVSHMFFVTVDDFDVPYVSRLRILKPDA